jgi:hypothetical protein
MIESPWLGNVTETREEASMATTQTTGRRPLDDLYPAEHPRKPRRRGVIDDTLDIHPPLHIFEGMATPEDLEAAQRLAAELGYPLPETRAAPTPPPAPADGVSTVNGAHRRRAAEAPGLTSRE